MLVSTQKGGVGKTTMSVNIVAAFSKLGYRILLIDADMKGHVILSFGKDPKQQQYILGCIVDVLPSEAAILNVAENKCQIRICFNIFPILKLTRFW
ncbi:hypothetical protein MTP04_30130 [Lysinibacillus sp. PLM2]|nr:hypothetical protein MTP04_30130 [Lysinibacillus sp. PLM2]